LERCRQYARERKSLFIFGDFMSEWATKLPHIKWQNRHEKEGQSIGTRVYAAQCIYGEIEGFVVLVVPSFLPGGLFHI
jgi:hypothetical protein